jgi:long-chain acyl-CoA synthetase
VNSCRQVPEVVDVDRFVLLLPMFHSFMLTVCILLPLLIGGSIVLIRSLHPPKNIIAEIIRHQATILAAIRNCSAPSPMRRSAEPHPADLHQQRRPAAGGRLARVQRALPDPPDEGYGLSEASPVVSMNPFRGVQPGSIGLPIPDVEVSIRSERPGVPRHTVGEVCVRGGNVMAGYWNNPRSPPRRCSTAGCTPATSANRTRTATRHYRCRKKDMLLVNGINCTRGRSRR